MSDNPSLIQQWFEAGDAGEFDAWDECLHPDVVVHAPLGLSTKGIEAEKEVWRRVLLGVPNIKHDVQEVVILGSTAAARIVVTGSHRGPFLGMAATGREFRIDQAVFAHVLDGKVIEAWEIADTAALLQQLGALPGD